MSLIAGIEGQKTELYDGAKINTVSEYTVNNGVQLQGRTSGVALTSPNVGYLFISYAPSTTAIAGDGVATYPHYYDLLAGVWEVWGLADVGCSSLTNGRYVTTMISTNNSGGFSTSDHGGAIQQVTCVPIVGVAGLSLSTGSRVISTTGQRIYLGARMGHGGATGTWGTLCYIAGIRIA
jgi:hypothetical protein